jgi:hypothetical protein
MAGWPDTLKGWAKFGKVAKRARCASLSSSHRAQVKRGGSMPTVGVTRTSMVDHNWRKRVPAARATSTQRWWSRTVSVAKWPTIARFLGSTCS